MDFSSRVHSEVAPCPLTPTQDIFPAWAFSLWFEVIIKTKPLTVQLSGLHFYYSMKIKSSLASTIWEIVEGWKYSEHVSHQNYLGDS